MVGSFKTAMLQNGLKPWATASESCASVGLVMFAHRMLKIEAKGEYGDVMERALYNNVLSGMALDGKSFFYVNPLEVHPEACEKNPAMEHIKPVRQKWYSCSCCPPNIARLIMSLNQYIYTAGKNSIYTHLYIGGKSEIDLDGTSVMLSQETNYPWDGNVRLKATAFGEKGWSDELYRPVANIEKETSIKAVPYFVWCNRKPGEMNVWIRQS